MFHASVHGLGTVGLPLAAVLATTGAVLGVEPASARRREVEDPDAPLAEPGLRSAVHTALETGLLRLAAHPAPAPVHLVCVPTPLGPDGADLSAVHAAVDALAPHLRPGDLVCLESTAPPDTVAGLAHRVARPGVHWAAAPERMLPGRALEELRTVDRVVGGLTPEATERAAAFYEHALGVRVHRADAPTAAAAKLVENTARYVQIALAGELHHLVSESGADPHRAFALARTHPRVHLLKPGIGVGGHCLPVDPWFLAAGADTPLLAGARAADRASTERALARIRSAADALEGQPLIGLLGISYKAGTGDVRHSAALGIARALRDEGRRIAVADPLAPAQPDLPWASVQEVAARADLAVLLVDHPELRELELDGPVLDLCGARS